MTILSVQYASFRNTTRTTSSLVLFFFYFYFRSFQLHLIWVDALTTTDQSMYIKWIYIRNKAHIIKEHKVVISIKIFLLKRICDTTKSFRTKILWKFRLRERTWRRSWILWIPCFDREKIKKKESAFEKNYYNSINRNNK